MNMIPAKASLVGQIIGPCDDVRVVAALHPLRQSRVERAFKAGTTLADMVDAIAGEPACMALPADFHVLLDGHSIEPAMWRLVRPKPGTTVVMRPVLTGFIAAAFAALSSLITSLGFFGKILMAVLSMGFKLLIGVLFPPAQPELAPERKLSYSATSSRNSAAPFDPVPVILGRHRFTGFYGAGPYTEVVGDDQYLRMIFVWGYGPLKIEDIKIGETLLSTFADVQIESREGYVGDAPITLYPTQVVEEQLSVELTFPVGYQRRTTAANVTEIAIDITLPNGLLWISQDGRNLMGINIEWRYRLVGATLWTTYPAIHFEAKTNDTIRKTYRVVVAAGQYEVEVKKADEEIEDTDSDTIVNTALWTALRGFRTSPPMSFPSPLAVTAVRIKATSQLNGTIDTLNAVLTSYVKAWTGSAWVANTASRNPAALVRHVLQGPANKRPVPDSKIDLVALQGWHDYCTLKGWTYDLPLVSAISVYDAVTAIAAAGRAVIVFKDAKWSVVWDEQIAPVVQMFTPRNSWGFEAQHDFREMPHAWRVRFINETKQWQQDERIVYDDGYTAENATHFEGLEFPGVTSPDLIWKHGRFQIAQLRLRPETYTINTDFENLICMRGDRVRFAHDVMLVGLASGRVTAVDAGTQAIVVDEELTMVGSTPYQLRFRLEDGTFLLRSLAVGSSGTTTSILLDGTGVLPGVGDLFTFGEVAHDSGVYRVLGIEQQDDLVARITLVDDAPDIYLADAGAIPAFNSNVSPPFDPYLSAPSNIIITEGIYQDGSDFFAVLRPSWRGPPLGRVQSYEVEYRNEADGIWRTGPSVLAPISTAEIRRLEAGLYTVRVRCRFDNNDVSSWTTAPPYLANMLTSPPPDVTGFRISSLGSLSTLTWNPVALVGVTYEIRFVAVSAPDIIWNAATPLVVGISGTSVQVPSMIGTYLIKAAQAAGLKSVNAAAVATNIADLDGLNVVEVLIEDPDFGGVKVDVFAEGGVLRLQSDNVISAWETLTTTLTMTTGDGDSMLSATEGIYYFEHWLDLGSVFTSRITALIDAQGESLANTMAVWGSLDSLAALDNSSPDDWEVTLEYRVTMVDPALDDWTEWAPFIVSDITARAFEFRLLLFGAGTTTPSVTRLRVQIDMPDRVIAGEDIVVPIAGLDIPFIPAFLSLHGIATADQDMATGDHKTITAKGPGGFHIQFFDAGSVPVERTMDFVAKGYGSLLA